MFERRVVSILSGRHIAHVQYLLEFKSENRIAIHAEQDLRVLRQRNKSIMNNWKRQYFFHTLSTSNHYLWQ